MSVSLVSSSPAIRIASPNAATAARVRFLGVGRLRSFIATCSLSPQDAERLRNSSVINLAVHNEYRFAPSILQVHPAFAPSPTSS
jgi:hypothetical protein